MQFIRNLYHKELSYLQKLNLESKYLIKSIFLFNLILPILSIFLTAFLFRQTQSLAYVGIFYAFLFFGITFGFYAIGLLLRKYSTQILMIFGLISMSGIFTILVFLSSINIFDILVFGFLYGITVGLYWANRNYLTVLTTISQNRIYFSSLESVSKSMSDIVVPLLIGGFLALGIKFNLYSSILGYRILALVLLFIVFLASLIILKMTQSINPVRLVIRNRNKNWTLFRIYNFAIGTISISHIFLMPLMILTLVGNEGELGALQSIASLISAIIVYGFAKSMKINNRFRLLTISLIIGFIGIAIFSLTFSALGVFVFMASIALSQPFWWTYMISFSYDLIDNETGNYPAKRYAALCDREIYINSGRIIAILIFLYLITNFSNDTALRYTPLIFIFSQLIIFLTAKIVESNKSK